MSHTKGPWSCEKLDSGHIIIQAEDNVCITQLPITISGVEQFDSKLISAAPDLLEALMYAEFFMTQVDPVHWPSKAEARKVIKIARDAISKAGC